MRDGKVSETVRSKSVQIRARVLATSNPIAMSECLKITVRLAPQLRVLTEDIFFDTCKIGMCFLDAVAMLVGVQQPNGHQQLDQHCKPHTVLALVGLGLVAACGCCVARSSFRSIRVIYGRLETFFLYREKRVPFPHWKGIRRATQIIVIQVVQLAQWHARRLHAPASTERPDRACTEQLPYSQTRYPR